MGNCLMVVGFGKQRKHSEKVWWPTTVRMGGGGDGGESAVSFGVHIQNGDRGLEERRLLACPPVPHFAMMLAMSLLLRKINETKIN